MKKKKINIKINKEILTLFSFFLFFFLSSPALALSDSLDTDTVYKIPESSSLFYLGDDLHRYIFPNSGTFDSWYDNYDDVVEVDADILNNTPIRGLVTVKPGGDTWVKIQSDPKVYTVSNGGILHWIPTENAAIELAGSDWAERIIDLPDTVFAGYTIGMPVDIYSPTMEFDEETAESINEDFVLVEPGYISIESSESTLELSVSDTVATITVGNAVQFENNSTDEYPEVIISGDNGGWSSGVIEENGDFITYFYETGFYHYDCRNAYNFDAPINTSCGTVTVVDYIVDDDDDE
jgi:hypothetical protein